MSDEDLDGDQTQDELVPSPSEYDDYSGLSDDLDLGMQDHGNDDEDDEANGVDSHDEDDDNVRASLLASRILCKFSLSFSSSSKRTVTRTGTITRATTMKIPRNCW